MPRHDQPMPLSRKDFYRALTVIWAFLWLLAAALHNAELWSTGLLWVASLVMVVTYALQVLRELPADKSDGRIA
jgi:hypothetical protein